MADKVNEKVQTLADLVRADASKITGGVNCVYHYNGDSYWVVTDTEKGQGPGSNWRWIGQLGNIHVFRKN
jgi:hypothetical protein